MKTIGECVCYSLCWPTACSALCCWGPMLAPPSPVIWRMSLMIDCLSTAAGKDTGRESENRPGWLFCRSSRISSSSLDCKHTREFLKFRFPISLWNHDDTYKKICLSRSSFWCFLDARENIFLYITYQCTLSYIMALFYMHIVKSQGLVS